MMTSSIQPAHMDWPPLGYCWATGPPRFQLVMNLVYWPVVKDRVAEDCQRLFTNRASSADGSPRSPEVKPRMPSPGRHRAMGMLCAKVYPPARRTAGSSSLMPKVLYSMPSE